jgi:hypothetical protein
MNRQLLTSEDYQLIADLGLPTPPLKAAQAFQEAFDMIGGTLRLAKWADKNPDKFYQLYSKLVPATVQIDEKKDIRITIDWATSDRLSYRQTDAIPHDFIPTAGPIQTIPQQETAVVIPLHPPPRGQDSGPGE